jgi:NAD(P)-dependent dehydrogenase (short-subunit alcohol dehydrogenase family)
MTEGFLDARAGLRGRTAVIIGGGGGIGLAVTQALAGAGVGIAACDKDTEALAAMRKAVAAQGVSIFAEALDATEPHALETFYGEVGRRFERLDIVVNVVGGVRRRPFMETQPEEWQADIHRNFGYVLQSIYLAVPLLRRSGCGGSIINFTTIEAHRGAAWFAVYAGAKAATVNTTRALAVELGRERIRVNCLAPDSTPSAGNRSALPPDFTARMAAVPQTAMDLSQQMYIPLSRPASTDDLANGVLFLASDLSRSVTGMTLHVDGGTMAASGFMYWPEGDGFGPRPLAGALAKLA